MAAARLKGFLESRGGVLSFIDSDDYIDQSMYEEMLKSLEEQNADIVFCDYNSITKNNIVKNAFAESDIKLDRERALKFLADDSLKSFMWNKLYKREVLQEEDFYIGRTMEDLLCMHHIFYRMIKVLFIAKVDFTITFVGQAALWEQKIRYIYIGEHGLSDWNGTKIIARNIMPAV